LAVVLVLFSANTFALTPGGTPIPNVANLGYQHQGTNLVLSSNQTLVTVNTLSAVTITPVQTLSLIQGQSIALLHTVTNNGNMSDTINLEAVSPLGLTAAFFAADGVTPLTDGNGDGLIDTGALPMGASLDIIVELSVPPATPSGQVANPVITATSAVNGAVNSSVTHAITIQPALLWSPLIASVTPSGQVAPGTLLTYTVALGNSLPSAVTGVILTDTLDPNLIYQSGSATAPTGLTGTVIGYDNATRTLTWSLPSVPAGYSGTVQFQVQVDPATVSDTLIENHGEIVSDQNATPQLSNATQTVVVEQPLRIYKESASSEAEIGDYVPYSITVENVSPTMTASAVTIIDDLPRGFRLLKGSSQLDGTPLPDPPGGTRPQWNIGSLAPGERKILTYHTLVSVDAREGKGVNRARATGRTPAGTPLASGPATATILVREGVLNSRTILLGRVFIDANGNGMPDAAEEGVAGVRLYLENGFFAVTDADGKYSMFGIDAGEHVIKLDGGTLPRGYRPVPIHSTFAGDGHSQFISVPFGNSARGDFPLIRDLADKTPPSPEETATPGIRKGGFTFGAELNAGPVPLEKQIATMPSTTAILEPVDGTVLESPRSDVVIRVPVEGEYLLRVNGHPLLKEQIGREIEERKKGIRICEYVGISFRPGRNRIVLERLQGGTMAESQEIEVILPGQPEQVILSPERADIPADGETTVPFTIRLLDRWNRETLGEEILTVQVGKGVIVEDDLDPESPGHQIRSRRGQARFTLRAPRDPGPDQIQVFLGTGLFAHADVYFTPELRDWVLVGLGNLTVGEGSLSGQVERISAEDNFEEGIYHEERLAFFAKGKILGKYLLTAAYDSEKKEAQSLFQEVDPERYYPIYGDAGDNGYEAQSQKKLFVKIERGRSSVLVGDYSTDLSDNELSRYDRSFNGVRAELDSEAATLRAFQTSTSQTLSKDEMPGDGTSGYYFLSKNPVLENSEQVRIEVRDRHHPERVVSTTVKTRYRDYTIDYPSGAILFHEPVSSLDPGLNPVTIVVLYESDDPGDRFQIYGGRAALRSKGGLELGVTAVVEEKALKNYTLTALDGTWRIGTMSVFKAEAAQSDSLEQGMGKAWKVELASRFDKLLLEAHYRDIGESFLNPSMSGTEGGSRKYGANAEYRLTEKSALGAEYFVQENGVENSRLSTASTSWRKRFKLFSAELGLRLLSEEQGSESKEDSALLIVEVGGNITKKLIASARREESLTDSIAEAYPTRTELRLDYRLDKNKRFFLTQEFQESDRGRSRATLMGTESRLGEHLSLTSGYQLENGPDGPRNLKSVELNGQWRPSDRFRLGTKTGYQLENALSEERGQALLGLNTRFILSKGLTLHATAERTETPEGQNSNDRSAFTLGAEYLHSEDYKVSGRYELKKSRAEDTHLYTLGGAYQYNPDLTLFARTSYWQSLKQSGDDTRLDASVSAAFRSSGPRSLYLLGLLRFKEEQKGSNSAEDREQSLVSSTEFSFKTAPRWLLTGKYAGKYRRGHLGGGHFQAYSDMLLAGIIFDLTESWYFGAYTKVMNQYETGMTKLGWIAKIGYRLRKNLLLGAGYNLSQLNDRDLDGEDYRAQGMFMELKFKFDENTFRLSDRTATDLQTPVLSSAVVPSVLEPPAVTTGDAVFATLSATVHEAPLLVLGSVELPTLFINGEQASLPKVDIELEEATADRVELRGAQDRSLHFRLLARSPTTATTWQVRIMDQQGEVLQIFEGQGTPPEVLPWNGRLQGELPLQGGGIYLYQLEIHFEGDTVASSARRLFGVDRLYLEPVTLNGGAFEIGSASLTPQAKALLAEIALVLRDHPDEQIIIEGHSDSQGPADINMLLSQRRCEAAASYLTQKSHIPSKRLILRWHGEERPLASNSLAEGRELNRRLEITGTFGEDKKAVIRHRFRAGAGISLADKSLAVNHLGRFATTLAEVEGPLPVLLTDSFGGSLQTVLHLPRLSVQSPLGQTRLPWGTTDSTSYRFVEAEPATAPAETALMAYHLSGQTDPGNHLELDGKAISLDNEGRFSVEMEVHRGSNFFGLRLQNAAGLQRLFQVRLDLTLEEETPEATSRKDLGTGKKPATVSRLP
jgi:uncharacterized repeat protein (TIGR01451 family)